MENLFSVPALISLITLTLLEIILGVDNIIFIAIIAGKLPHKKEQRRARTIGLTLALIIRVLMLSGISWLAGSTQPIFHFNLGPYELSPSVRDLILLVGGVFLLYKTGIEIYEKISGHEGDHKDLKALSVNAAILQIVLIDIVFSFDSILTAVGLSRDLPIMIAAVVISMIIMLVFSEKVSDFINQHPTVKILALAFLILIGGLLVLESIHIEVEKGYVYFALAFSLIVEYLNIKRRSIAAKAGHSHKSNE
ncbi:MAG: TerC family protein [Bacteroidia bacterium]|nr:TerC family protein [Bacteroidia bacterium]